jgi:hypothetical protein
MSIALSRLSSEATPLTETATIRKSDQKTAFLCHSHKDAKYVTGFVAMLRKAGWDIYVDWQDSTMPATPNRETAYKIKRRIKAANYFIFLATPNSVASRWCPWEIGYADGVVPIESMFVVTTKDGSGHYGNEYLGLYRHIDLSNQGDLAAWNPGEKSGIRVARL